MDIHQLGEFIANHALLVMALAVIVILLLAGEIRHRISGVRSIEPIAATRMLNHENAVMVDVRDDKEYASGHIVNAVHAPGINDSSLKQLEKVRTRPLIVYCRSGQRSGVFAGQLRKRGFETVYNLKGGLLAWQNASLPLSKSQAV